MRSPETSVICAEAANVAAKSKRASFMGSVPQSFFDLGKPDLAGEAQVFSNVTLAVLP
jgi:hypothetical protein